jgi:SAM-dependent methyltransferase
MVESTCRFCRAPVTETFADLGMSPLANNYLTAEQRSQMEPFYPLRALVCGRCFLVQLEEYESPDVIFSDYAYFSSYSTTWLEHSARYVDDVVERFGLTADNRVVELASNDGYLLRNFVDRGIPVRGVEPAANVAKVAEEQGVPTVVKFFGRATARELAASFPPDLIVANNVLAHVPDLNDFVAGMKVLLKPGGVITVEFPHLMRLVEGNEWDTIYHEHFSYFSWLTVSRVFAEHGLKLWDVEELPTHGGSLRIYGAHADDDDKPTTERARELAERERAAGYDDIGLYREYAERVVRSKWDLLDVLIEQRRAGRRVVAYGAPAKGNTLLNYCGIGTDLVEFTVDRNPHKQGRYLPGSHIPIRTPEDLLAARPDLVLILPWNLRDEITEQLAEIREWGGRFLVRAPRLEVIP